MPPFGRMPVSRNAGLRMKIVTGVLPQAQSLDACNPSDLQDNKPLTAKRMKGMGYLCRTQKPGARPARAERRSAWSPALPHHSMASRRFGSGK